ncbi:WHG domain-containing protein [Streptomyces brevispora]|uniref:WHG domain-containing protein n=1 Tax=Streptomyces brevispora TaxID=887462 RepID=A0ABZ1G6B1_9ACTN|nr:WHG domain-containing protein [Streptomyces brevispora]WSC15330.1 WHG domain-containing protein [Streptomyces brevispora]
MPRARRSSSASARRSGSRARRPPRRPPARSREQEDAALAGTAAWSLAHGFATLLLSGNLGGAVGDRDPEEVFRSVAGLLFDAEGPH